MTVELAERRISRRSALVACVVVLLLFAIQSFVSLRLIYNDCYSRLEASKPPGYLARNEGQAHAPKIVRFESGKNTLRGYVYGEGNNKGLVVMSHGLGASAEDYLPEAMYFVDKGWRVFAFDNTGTYSSEGDDGIGLPQSVLDLDAALTYVESDPSLRDLPVMLFGHSCGGYANTAVLKFDHDVAAVASVSGFNSPLGMLNEEMKRLMGPLAYAVYPYGWTYRAILFGSAVDLTAVDGINNSDAAVMIIHGSADESVSYDGASIISQRDKITNSNTVFKTCSEENRNGHSSLLRSQTVAEPDPVLFGEINAFFEAHVNR